ncbi:tail fiber domain-containing protein [Psychroserpens sp. XS_ASV72]|uniref:tail fiber domain-containing protein n=1 Tax=Psychroserpens sp. XS_ASV72 TaxID=3241293 RepID=UPI003517C65C
MKTKLLLLGLCCLGVFTTLHAQVGVGTTNPQSTLDIEASNVTSPTNSDGILIPRVSNFPASNPTAAQDGMLVFYTGTASSGKGFYYWDQSTSSWIFLTGAKKINDLLDGKSDDDGSQDGSSLYIGVLAGDDDDGTDNRNVGIGYLSLAEGANRTNNTAVGYSSLATNEQGNNNTAIGYNTMLSNYFGDNNTAIGYESLFLNHNGENNVALGYQAGYDNLSGNNNTYLGYGTGNNGSNGVFVGYQAGSTASGNNKLYIENTNANASNALIYGEFGSDNTTTGNLLRTNSEFQIGNPTGTGYAFPTVDGTINQVLATDGAGQLSFLDASSLGGNTLDQAYDQGGAGAGRTITADNGAVDIQNTGGLRVEGNIVAGESIIHDGDNDTFLNFTTDRIEMDAGNWNYIDIQHANQEIAINEDGRTIDFRVESDTNQNILFVDGTNSRIGIGTNTPGNPLHIGLQTTFDTNIGNTGQDGIFIRGSNTTGLDEVGGSISFGGAHPARDTTRRTAIASMQTGIDEDNVGLAFYIHQGPVNTEPMQEAMRITHQKYLGINNTSPSATLDVVGSMQFVDGNEAAGYVLSSDAAGNASWTNPSTIFTDTDTTYDGTDFALSNQTVPLGQYVRGIDAFGNLIAATDQDSQTLNLVGSTLSILNGNSVNLSSLTDNDWVTVGADIERQNGDVYIGNTANTNNNLYISNRIIDWDNSTYVLDPGGDNRMNEIELDNGTIADPSLYFEGDPDFGFNYDNLNNEIFLSDNGSVALTLRKDGGIEPSNGIKIGGNAGTSNTAATSIFLGTQSGLSNTSGASNIGIGYFSLRSTTTNGSNIAIGTSALRDYVGNAVPGNNLAIGHNTMGSLTGGTLNTALGIGAMQNINFDTTTNVAVGTYSLRNLGSGSGNIALGYSAGNLASGSYNLFLGTSSGFNSSGNRNVFIGHNAGYNAPAGNDMLYIENTNSNTPLIYGEFLSNLLRINGELQVGIPTGTGYAFPTTDGTANQLLATDGSGQLNFVNASTIFTDTDDQTIDTFSFNSSTNVLTLEIENDGVAAQTVDLSSLTDNDWTEVGADIERQSGDVYIGDTSGTDNDLYISNSIIDWDDNSYLIDPGSESFVNEINFDAGSNTDPSITFDADTNTGFYRSEADAIGFTSNGTARMQFTTRGQIEFTNIGNSTFIGFESGQNDDFSNNQNVGVGDYTLTDNTSGQANVALGYLALRNNETGNSNVGVGYGTLFNNISGDFNVALGRNALGSNNDGSQNIGIGNQALSNNTSGDNNVAIGHQALINSTADNNIGIGQTAGNAITSGTRNIAIGYRAQAAHSTGNDNIVLGDRAMDSSTSSSSNIALGRNALTNMTEGDNNIAIGQMALGMNVGASPNAANNNIAIGHQAGQYAEGDNNIYIGYQAGRNDGVASNHLYIENSSADSNNALIYGEFDNDILRFNGDVGIGRTPSTNALEVEGEASKATAGAFIANSDRRLKSNIETISTKTALQKLLSLRGVSYEWNDNQTETKRPEGIQYGFIAQELMEVFPEKVTKDNLGFYQTAYGDYDAFFVQAIKELNNKVETLEAKNAELQEKLNKLEALEARILALEGN